MMLRNKQLNNKTIYGLVIRLINVSTQSTPNPNFLKFIPQNKTLMQNYETMDFTSSEQSQVSPLATELFKIQGVNRVFYGNNYISISKIEQYTWETLKPLINSAISDFYEQDKPLFNELLRNQEQQEVEEDSEAVEAIKEILDSRIRPVVQEDGGDIKYVRFDEEKGIVYLSMQGSCSGCPSSGDTLKNGIERMLQYYVAEVNSVQAIDYEG